MLENDLSMFGGPMNRFRSARRFSSPFRRTTARRALLGMKAASAAAAASPGQREGSGVWLSLPSSTWLPKLDVRVRRLLVSRASDVRRVRVGRKNGEENLLADLK